MRTLTFVVFSLGLAFSQTKLPVEALQALAREKIGAFLAELNREMPELLNQLATLDPEIAGPQVEEPRSKLGRFVPAFPEKFLEALKTDARPRVRVHLLAILARFGSEQTASILLRAVPDVGEALAVALVEVAGSLGKSRLEGDLLAMASQSPPPAPSILGALLKAAALSKSAASLTAARAGLTHADSVVRQGALQALSVGTSGTREDFASVQKAAQNDADPEVRKAAIRALQSFAKLTEAQRLAHESLTVSDSGFQSAALDALERIGTRDSSPPHLLQFVQTSAPDPLRERAARLMSGPFDDMRGARHLAKPLRDDADRNPKDVAAQMEAGDYLKSLLAYEDAILLYKRGSSLYAPPQQWRARVQLARCNARLARFDEAKRLLRADYKDRDIAKNFADDPDFSAMKADSRFKSLFEAPKGE